MNKQISDKITFSNLNRDSRIKSSIQIKYDLIIIGGGITGAGIFLDASLRGIKVLLVEKLDFASGTSSKSTKLIHGGLRYLKQLEIGLVRETGLERAVAHHNIPHLVHPESMLLPIVENGTFGKLSASLAITVYDKLANVPNKDRKKVLSKEQALFAEPLMNKEILKSGIIYSEYRTDDARLTIEIIKAGIREGGHAFNYMEVKDFVYVDSQIAGIKCIDLGKDEEVIFNSKQVVSAAGPWVDKLREINKSKKNKNLHLTKGVHVVVPFEKLPIQSSLYFDSPDGRMMFAIPRGSITYIGTSDTNYTGDLDNVLCTKKDVDYILSSANNMFTINPLQFDDVESTWAGLRPLIHEEGKSPSELSRKDEIFESKSGLVSIAGGKLTGYRKMSQRIIDLVQKKHANISQKKCTTELYKIHHKSFDNYHSYQEFRKSLYIIYGDKGLNKHQAWYYSTTYGKDAITIINSALDKSTNLEIDLLKSEIEYCVKHESVFHPLDFINRRTGRAYFEIHFVHKHLSLILNEFKNIFKWNEDLVNLMRNQCIEHIKDLTEIKE